MLRRDQWLVSGLIIAGLTSSVGGGISLAAEPAKPARLEQIPGSDLKRVVLTPKAAERLAIKTAKVREEPVVRWLTVAGEVEATKAEEPVPVATASASRPVGLPTASDAAPVRVRVSDPDPDRMIGQPFPGLSLGISATTTDDDVDDVKSQTKGKDEGQQKGKSRGIATTVIVVPISDDSGAKRWRAIPIEAAPGADASETATGKYYLVNHKNHNLRAGQRVYVWVSQPTNSTPQKVIPYSAVIYDSSGKTWTYTNPEPLVFVRHRIDVDSIEGDRAVLKEGPAIGTIVVTAGAAELMGVEQKFGH
jgi:hypothetical protein